MCSSQAEDGLRVFVFDSPRTCSQLFNKLFAAHPQLSQIFHPFMGASMYGPERVTAQLMHSSVAEEAQQELVKQVNLPDETYEVAVNRLNQSIFAIEDKGKVPYIKDHIFCVMRPDVIRASLDNGLSNVLPTKHAPVNPTMLHDELFRSVQPIILIRHPALTISSYFRAEKAVFKSPPTDEAFAAMITLNWARIVFDSYAKIWENDNVHSHRGLRRHPIVIDAADIVYNTEKLMLQLCHKTGIDPDGIQYHWDPVPQDQWPKDPIMRGFFQDLLRSGGVQRPRSGPAEHHLDVETMNAEWIQEFGMADAKALRLRVDEEMANYKYLGQFKLSV